LEITSLSSIH